MSEQTNQITITAEYNRMGNSNRWESTIKTKIDQGDPICLPDSYLKLVLKQALEELEIYTFDEFQMYAYNERLFCEDDEEEEQEAVS